MSVSEKAARLFARYAVKAASRGEWDLCGLAWAEAAAAYVRAGDERLARTCARLAMNTVGRTG